MKRVVISVGPTGKVSIEAEGFTGPSCTEATKVFEEAFAKGAKAGDRDLKPEYYADETIGNKTTQQW